jgi:HAE1 family hydrophobic/amphiphilic exporter-1
MQLLGFSVNMLTLFALVLAIGIVVDNAIVVVEAVHVKMHEEKLSPYKASVAAMKEIGGAIVAITLVMSAVFVPVGFMEGTVGIFYRQFSLTLAVAIVISGVNALTLSPALCALLLRPAGKGKKKAVWLRKFFVVFNRGYDRFERRYDLGLHKYLGRKFFTYATLVIFLLATYGMNLILPTGFIPNEDQGMVYVNVDAPPGATVERSEKVLNEIQAALLPFDEIESISTLAGYSLMTETEGASYGMGMINLKPWSEREQGVNELLQVYKDRTSHIKDADIQFFLPPSVPGFGNASGFELRLQDKTAGDFHEFAEVADRLVEKLNADPRLRGVTSGFNPNFPQYMLKVDLAKAAKLGVDLDKSMETLQAYIGSFYSSNFIRFGQMYKVMIQASPEYRMKPEDLYRLYAKNNDGNVVPYSNFMTMDRVYGPSQITRYNMFTSALITGEGEPGVSTGDVIRVVEEICKEVLPRGYDVEWSGVTREEKDSGGQTFLIFGICLLFVYLLLAAQYENLLLPLSVILSLPAGVFGSYFFLQLAGLENNIYAQVALVMLIGLLGKNAILIVEMANQFRHQGLSAFDAAVKGAVSRLRPILMTSFAFICGLIPLLMASGAGALGNRSIGTAAAGGMFIGTVVGIFLVPGLYLIFETLSARLSRNKVQYEDDED